MSDKKWKDGWKGFGYVYGKKRRLTRISPDSSKITTSERLRELPVGSNDSDVSGHTGSGIKVKSSDGGLIRGLPGMNELKETK